jgi:hypothetical protein
MEVYLLIPLFGGLLVVACAWIWLLVRAFQQGVWWGLACSILPPLALWFAMRYSHRAVAPLVLVVAGGVASAVPASYLLVIPAPEALQKTSPQESRLWSLTSKALHSDLVHEWVESRSYFLQVGAVPIVACAWIWLLVRAFRERRAWGWTSLFLPPAGLAFAARHPRRGAAPLILLVLAVLVATVPAVYILCVQVDLGPRDKNVGGKRHVTLTGWDRDDYSVLRLLPDVSVLQMANADVTDHVVENLRGMKNLEELDLNGTQVTDVGLGIIRELPVLATLRLARTKITDKGFRDFLATKESLMQLDLQHTQVGRDTVKTWRAGKPDRKPLQ